MFVRLHIGYGKATFEPSCRRPLLIKAIRRAQRWQRRYFGSRIYWRPARRAKKPTPPGTGL